MTTPKRRSLLSGVNFYLLVHYKTFAYKFYKCLQNKKISFKPSKLQVVYLIFLFCFVSFCYFYVE